MKGTDEEFEQQLADDIGWRRLELQALKKALGDAASNSEDSPAARGLSRAMVAMSYAHWEGYVKNALTKYARLVSRRKPKVSEARDGLVLEHVFRLLKRIDAGDESAKLALIDATRGVSDARVQIEKSVLADTRSNLRFNVLEDLFTRGCIPMERFRLKANLIDVLLCDRRNAVAHGKHQFVSAADSIDLCVAVIELIEEFREIMIVQVRDKRYLDIGT